MHHLAISRMYYTFDFFLSKCSEHQNVGEQEYKLISLIKVPEDKVSVLLVGLRSDLFVDSQDHKFVSIEKRQVQSTWMKEHADFVTRQDLKKVSTTLTALQPQIHLESVMCYSKASKNLRGKCIIYTAIQNLILDPVCHDRISAMTASRRSDSSHKAWMSRTTSWAFIPFDLIMPSSHIMRIAPRFDPIIWSTT